MWWTVPAPGRARVAPVAVITSMWRPICSVARGAEAGAAGLLAHDRVAEALGEEAERAVGREAPQRRPGEAEDGVAGAGFGRGELELEPVGIGEGDEGLAEALVGAFGDDAVALELDDPVLERLGGDEERGGVDHAGAAPPGRGHGEGEEGEDRAGPAAGVAEIEVVGAGIVEIDGELDQAEPEDAGVEIDAALGVGRDRGDVVDAGDGVGHGGLRGSRPVSQVIAAGARRTPIRHPRAGGDLVTTVVSARHATSFTRSPGRAFGFAGDDRRFCPPRPHCSAVRSGNLPLRPHTKRLTGPGCSVGRSERSKKYSST